MQETKTGCFFLNTVYKPEFIAVGTRTHIDEL